jgi:uncharacterized protein (DUF305 family)
MKPRLFRISLAAAALGTAAILASCSNNNDMSGMPGMSSGPAVSSSSPPSDNASAADFNNADVMFAQMMIPHHQQAIEMCDIILTKSGVNPKVTALAHQIKDAQQPEITTMSGWLHASGRSPLPNMSGMPMANGEISAADMKKLEEADGPTAQKLFLEGMIEHHKGAIQMAHMEISSGKNPHAVNLAKSIAASQQKEITTMTQLLEAL